MSEELKPGEVAPPYTDAPASAEASDQMTPAPQNVQPGVGGAAPVVEAPVVASGGETIVETPSVPPSDVVQIVVPPQAEIDAHPGEKWNFEHQCWLPKEQL